MQEEKEKLYGLRMGGKTIAGIKILTLDLPSAKRNEWRRAPLCFLSRPRVQRTVLVPAV
jgi:hypothetical protein